MKMNHRNFVLFGFKRIISAVILGAIVLSSCLMIASCKSNPGTNPGNESNSKYTVKFTSDSGFTSSDIPVIQRGMSNVYVVEGSCTVSISCFDSTGASRAMKAHSLPGTINTLTLTAGRFPTAADECVVDAAVFSSSDVGKTLTISDYSSSSPMANATYRIVGLAESPLYTESNRIAELGGAYGFMYVIPQAFSLGDYFSEIYVKLNINFSDYEAGSTELSSLISTIQMQTSQLCNQLVESRYNELKVAAQNAYNSAEDAYQAALAKYNAQLESAKSGYQAQREKLKDDRVKAVGTYDEFTEMIKKAEAAIADYDAKIADIDKQISNPANAGSITWLQSARATYERNRAAEVTSKEAAIGYRNTAENLIKDIDEQLAILDKQETDANNRLAAEKEDLDRRLVELEKLRVAVNNVVRPRINAEIAY